jgi:hypothetical protein
VDARLGRQIAEGSRDERAAQRGAEQRIGVDDPWVGQDVGGGIRREQRVERAVGRDGGEVVLEAAEEADDVYIL